MLTMLVAGGLLIASAPVVSMAHAGGGLPGELVGEWATDASVFRADALREGLAMYLTAEGVGMLIAAPPPIGAHGSASYDSKTHVLTLRLREQGRPVATCAFRHDAGAVTLRAQGGACGEELYRRRRDRVPDHISRTLK
jgi:hypothetical protein